MAHTYATLVVLFVGGGLVALLVTGNAWPLICVAIALRYLLKVFAACEPSSVTPAKPSSSQPTFHRGRKDWRMPT